MLRGGDEEESMTRRRGGTRKARQGFCAGALGAVLLLPAAGPAQVPPELPRATGSVELSLVNVDVVVTGKDGRPVEGLAASDFTVLHGKKPVAITNFRE